MNFEFEVFCEEIKGVDILFILGMGGLIVLFIKVKR